MMSRPSTVITTGFVALDVIHSPFGQPLQFAAGGSCGNVSANLARFGVRVQLVARLGCDDEGQGVIEDLAAQGVGLTNVSRGRDVRTPVVIHEVLDGHGGLGDHRFVLNAPASGDRLPRFTSITDRQVEQIIGSGQCPRVLYFDRLSRAIVRLAGWAHNQGSLIFFEPSNAHDLSLLSSARIHVDILKCSADRVTDLRGSAEPTETPITIWTMGSKGLRLQLLASIGDAKVIEMPAIPVTKIIDSAGSGDAVSSALIHKIVLSDSFRTPSLDVLVSGLLEGQRLASLNCGFVGARGAFRSLDAGTINAFLVEKLQMSDVAAGNRSQMPAQMPAGLKARYAYIG
jgi:fructokinase